MTQPLKGLKVLDLSRALALPYCSMMLGDMGAEVIHVERPETGDDFRQLGPPWVGDQSAAYLCVNRNKKSIALDLKKDKGREIVRRLARRSDVFLENFLPGTLSQLGLGYEELKSINPGMIYASVSGYGQHGPSRDLPGWDFVMQARGGLMSVTGYPGGQPLKVGVAIVDVITGLFSYGAILTALRHKERTGAGQHIDLALLDSLAACLVNQGSNYLASGRIPQPMGNAHPNLVPYAAFQCRDGAHIVLAVANDHQWRKFCKAASIEDLRDDPRFATNPKRVENRETLTPVLEELLSRRDSREWLDLLTGAEIPCAPIQTLDQVFADPQILARGMLIEMEHPGIGKFKIVGSPLNFSQTPVQYRMPPPRLGEHTEEILKDLGYDDASVRVLREEKVI